MNCDQSPLQPFAGGFPPTPEGPAIDWLWRRRAWRTVATVDDAERLRRLEAALFVADRPYPGGRLAKAAQLSGPREVDRLVGQLNADYESARSAMRIEKLASGYRMLTRPQLAFYLDQFAMRPDEVNLSPAALETVTVVAYRQPATRAEVEAVRGVASLELLKQLMDRGLVRIVGEDDSLGRPFLYGTTATFLDLFDLESLADLPEYETLAG